MTLYEELRFPGLAKFFDNSTKKTRRQSLQNRLQFIKKANNPWNNLNLNNDSIRVLLKNSFLMYSFKGIIVKSTPLG